MTNSFAISTVLNQIEKDRVKKLSAAEKRIEDAHSEAIDMKNEIAYNEMMYT